MWADTIREQYWVERGGGVGLRPDNSANLGYARQVKSRVIWRRDRVRTRHRISVPVAISTSGYCCIHERNFLSKSPFYYFRHSSRLGCLAVALIDAVKTGCMSLKMKVIWYVETSVTVCHSTRRNIQMDFYFCQYRCENIKSDALNYIFCYL
jgi:hypothetical protein